MPRIKARFWMFDCPVMLVLMLMCSTAAGQPEGRSRTATPFNQNMLSDLFETNYVVDGHVNPRLWFGCCKNTASCLGTDAQQKTECHRWSDPLATDRLYTEVGAHVAFTPVSLNPNLRRPVTLPHALLNSNQLVDTPKEQSLRFVYVAELEWASLADYRAVAKWSKYQHLAGVRSIRLTAEANLDVTQLDYAQIKKSLGILFGRYFLIDVGALPKQHLEFVLGFTTPRRIPVLVSGVHLGSPHPCASGRTENLIEPKTLCEIAKSDGVFALGPSRALTEKAPGKCDQIGVVNQYIFDQFKAFNRLSCSDGESSIRMQRHLAVRSHLPILEVTEPSVRPTLSMSRWGKFAQHLLKASVSVDDITHLLGLNLERLMRKTLPGVQPATLLFPVDNRSLTGDKGIQFQWTPPKKNDPKRMAGQIFGMRRAHLVIEKGLGDAYAPWRTETVISGDRKSIKVILGNFRWRIVSANRKTKVSSDWGYFSVTDMNDAPTPTSKQSIIR